MQKYREEFIRTCDRIFATFQEEFEGYAYHSKRLRDYFLKEKRRFPLLHRNGQNYLVSASMKVISRALGFTPIRYKRPQPSRKGRLFVMLVLLFFKLRCRETP